MTPYQFLVPYDIVLPRQESFEVGHFKANIEIIWPFLKLWGCCKTMSWGPKNWYGVAVWVILNDGVGGKNPHEISPALVYIHPFVNHL